MKTTPRPPDPAPTGMGGATRMVDPSEAGQDRVRRRVMLIALVLIGLLNAGQLRCVEWSAVHWLRVVVMLVAGVPLGLGVRVFELRFKMATAERALVLDQLPARRKAEFVAYALIAGLAFFWNGPYASWALAGCWLYDFITYFYSRPQRLRHLYAVTLILDELRRFPAPWAWALPALLTCCL